MSLSLKILHTYCDEYYDGEHIIAFSAEDNCGECCLLSEIDTAHADMLMRHVIHHEDRRAYAQMIRAIATEPSVDLIGRTFTDLGDEQ